MWFFTFPTSFLNDSQSGFLVILLEDEKLQGAFHLLKVPFEYFRENRAKFDMRKAGNEFDLHISARKASWMHDLRSQGVTFGQFCVLSA